MHVGRTTGALQPLLKLANGQLDGAVSADGRVAGCYIHGLLADDRQRRHWLQRIGGQASTFAYESDVDATLDLLADHLEKHIDCDRLLALAREPRLRP
jgi:adenosylcobyric acid synthase